MIYSKIDFYFIYVQLLKFQIRDQILDLLTTNELPTTRTISKTWNQLVLNYSGLKRRLADKNIDFDEDRNGVEKIVKFNVEVHKPLPFSRFSIEFDLAPFPELEQFIQNYGKLVTHLRLGRPIDLGGLHELVV